MSRPAVHCWAIQLKDDLRRIGLTTTFPDFSINGAGASAYFAIPGFGLVRISDHPTGASKADVNIVGCATYLEALETLVTALNEKIGCNWFVHRKAPILRDYPPPPKPEQLISDAEAQARAKFWAAAAEASPFVGRRKNVKKLLKKSGISFPPTGHS